MIALTALAAAREAVAANETRPATALLHDSADLRLVVFRLLAGQSVPQHRSVSTVMLTVLAGSGVLSGEGAGAPDERVCSVGDCVIFAPNELHALRATDSEFVVLAAITPRPGSR